jgi:bifunctional UDP-N-acetylglucosamine pyrophosphorylase/glucosamine-1-phosphate N-acetyltransferase
MSLPLSVLILAAGEGKRMASRLPKVMQLVAGRPMLAHVLATARALEPADLCIVYGHGGEAVRAGFTEPNLRWVLQERRLGTGHAVAEALPGVPPDHRVLVLYGDVPLVRASTLRALLEDDSPGISLLSVQLDDPAGYGRVIRDPAGAVARIVESRDASAEEARVCECNTGIVSAPAGLLAGYVQRLDNRNAQGELYLTDVIGIAVAEGVPVHANPVADPGEVLGANDRIQLATLEAAYRRRAAETLMRAGATLVDPARIDVRGEVGLGRDCVIDVNVVLEGVVQLGDGVRVGANCILRDCTIGEDSLVHPFSLLEGARVAARCQVGPYARLRPGAELEHGARVGNFVEVKQALIGEGAKVNHLSYVGDASVGAHSNIGAGTITCNYDGARKHRTVIGEGAFIGSNSALVAPVEIGANATVGAGSTICNDVPAGSLAVTRARQKVLPGWQRPRKSD